MRIGIIGGGAIGLLCAYYLKGQGHDVTLVTRTENQMEQIQSHGIHIQTQEGNLVEKIKAVPFSKTMEIKNLDLWIITLKQTHLNEFYAKWKNGSNHSSILFLQNGMGHLEKAKQRLKAPIIAGVVTHGAMKVNGYTVKHTGMGCVYVGNWSGISTEVINSLTEKATELFPIHQSENIDYMLKRKLLINLMINPLTAIYGVKNGQLLNNPYWEGILRNIFQEGCLVLSLQDEEWDYVAHVIEITAENESSMLRDRKQGRKTEIEAITGYILELAKEKDISVPFTYLLHQSILGLETEGTT